MKKILGTSAIMIVVAVTLFMTSATNIINVYAKSPYDSGFDHGCDDSHISDSSDRYINQDEKGPAYHTTAFMKGYYEGFKECGYDNGVLNSQVNTAIDDSNFDDHSVSQPQTQLANTNQVGQCPQQIINGDCILGQSQDVNNEFAQANRNN
jgi:hypothetical protein